MVMDVHAPVHKSAGHKGKGVLKSTWYETGTRNGKGTKDTGHQKHNDQSKGTDNYVLPAGAVPAGGGTGWKATLSRRRP